MSGLLSRLVGLLSSAKLSRIAQARGRRKLRVELLEGRQLLAASITGSVFQDLTENGIDGSDPRLSGVSVALFRDGGNSTYDNGGGDDIASGTATSATTTGAYSFSVSTAGIYYLVQTSVSSGLIQRTSQRVQTIVVTPTQVNGTVISTIDTFDTTAQDVESPSSGSPPAFSAVAATEALGGERDMFVDASSGTISMQADTPSTTNFLAFDVGAGANGTRLLVYDGADGDAQILDNDGLETAGQGIDLTTGGTATGFRFAIGGETGTSLIITVHSGANSSSATVAIPTTSGASPSATLDVDFSSFTTSSGTGADFTDVGAVTFEVTGPNAADAIIDNIGTVGPTVITQNIANLAPMTIGNQVFRDVDNDGLFDSGESGISGVTLQLFSDTNGNGVFNAGTDIQALDSSNVPITTTTNSSGVYTFTNLLPGSYFVVIPSSQTATGGAAAGFIVSTTTPAQPNDANKGSSVSGTGIVTSLVSLSAGAGPTTDGDSSTSTDLSFDIGLVPQIDLTVQKTTAQTVATTGATVTYSITARNDGPSAANNVTLSDDVPDGLRVISFTSSDGTDVITIPSSAQDTTAANPDNITITAGTLAASTTTQRTYTMVAEVLAITTGTGAPAAIVNSVTIAGETTEIGNLPNTSTVSLPVQLSNDLVTVKTITTNPASTGTPAIAAPGSTITYTVIARNDGPSRATSVRIADDLPDGIQVLTATSSDNTDTVTIPASAQDTTASNPDDLIVTVGELLVGSGNQTTITITAIVLGTTSGLFTNVSTISSTDTSVNTDVLTTNNTSSVQANAQRSIDLVVNKTITTNPASTATPATAPPGSTFTYTITARNDGPMDATTVRVVDDLPDGIRIISATSSDNTDVVTLPSSAQDTTAANPDDLIVDIGNLGVGIGAVTTITVIGVVLNSTLGSFTNTATIAATDTNTNVESVTTNNTATVAATAPRTVDLAVTKNGPSTAVAGNTITYTMTATNNGPSDAINVQVVDDIPDGIRIISAAVNGSSITIPSSASDTTSANPDNLTFSVGSLASGASNTTITIVAAILPGSTSALVNNAVISTTDTNSVETPTTNNSASVTTTLTAQNDVAITKTGPSTLAAGSQVTYTLNVTNNGPSTATSVSVVDTLPTGVTFVSGTSLIGSTQAGSVASGSNNTANVTIPALAPNETAVVTILANVAATSTGSITNTVTVTATNDTVSTNNTATATTTLTLPVQANISGRLYVDSNNDGTGQTTESGISGITVTLTGTPTGGSASITRTTTTDTNGDYNFMNVDAGLYTVTASQPGDFTFRAANPGTTGGTAGTRQITSLPLAGVSSTSNNVGFTRVFSKRMFLASSDAL